MLKNNNIQAVWLISSRSMKQNRIRNLFVMLAIILTTFMFTTVFSVGFSLSKNINTMLIRQQGTLAQIFLMHPTKEQIKQAEKCSALNHAGVIIPAAAAKPITGEDFQIQMTYHDKENFQYNVMPALTEVKGSYPASENEIMLSSGALKALKIKNIKIGMKIPLMVNGEEKTFLLAGYFKDYVFRTNSYDAYVSKAFSDSLKRTAEKDGMLSISARNNMSKRLLEQLYRNVALLKNQDFSTSFDTSEDGLMDTMIPILLFICLLIVISGYLLIYNIMYASVSKDIRFYGLLKTIGTSSGQIRKIVKMQAFRLSALGIPIGIMLSAMVSFAAVPFALNIFAIGQYSAMPSDISFHPLIYIGTALFAIATVSLSCRKPAKLAGNISPVEALKYNGIKNANAKPRKTTDGQKLSKMAFRNVFREKKRAVLVFASLLMGTLVLFATQVFFDSIKLENYAEHYVPDDYALFPNCISGEDAEETKLDPEKVQACEKLAQDIKKIDGITNVMVNRSADVNLLFDSDIYTPFMKNDIKIMKNDIKNTRISFDELLETYNKDKENSFSAEIIGVDKKMIERHNKKTKQKIDLDAFEKGEICFVGYVDTKEQARQLCGKTITFINPGTGKRREIKIGACARQDDSVGLNLQYNAHLLGVPSCILVSHNVIDELTDTPYINSIIATCNPKAEAQVTKQIKELASNNSCIPSVAHIEIKSELLEEFQSSMMAMTVLTCGVSIVLILIGLLNFVNVTLTGIFTRRRELAVMESVGMTKSQIKKLLMLEGVYYGAITSLLIVAFGSAVIYASATFTAKAVDYAVFHYPWQLLAAVIVTLMAICILLPASVYKILSKESVTERLRMAE